MGSPGRILSWPISELESTLEEEGILLNRARGAEAHSLLANTLRLLDFHTVRDQVAGRTTFAPAQVLAADTTPSFNLAEVTELHKETAEGALLLDRLGDLDLGAGSDCSDSVGRAAKGGVMTGLDLLSVARYVDVFRRARSAVLSAGTSTPTLTAIAGRIADLGDIDRRISSRIGGNGEVLDGATPTLGALRRQVRAAYERLTEALGDVMSSPSGKEALQDRVVAVRSERLVVQVKRELRDRVPGIVHDASNTGATLFVEPFATADLGNTWRELVLEEEWETEKVLRELSEAVGEAESDITVGTQMTARLDLVLARARHGVALGGVSALGRDPSRPTEVRLNEARHPLLGEGAVPITMHISRDRPVMVITGPNTGGKTVAMKTLGLLALMHQSGLRVPAADESTLPVFEGIYTDIGDQQSVEGSVSTFGSHISNVIDILSHATSSSLVLLDELGTSTDPEEGAALAKAVLGHLARKGVATVATTHHRSVAAHTEVTPGTMNASVDLDPKTLKPTFRLTMGVPGRSYAMSVAEQLGLPKEIMEEARSLLEPQHRRFEDWLGELQRDRDQLKESLAEAEQSRQSSEHTRRLLQDQLDDLEDRRKDILRSMQEELAQQYDDARKKLRRAEAALSWGAPVGDVKSAAAEIAEAKSDLVEIERTQSPTKSEPEDGPLAIGDTVDVRGMNVSGTVLSLLEGSGEIDVSIGDVRLRLDASRVSPTAGPEHPEDVRTGVGYELGPILSTGEVDVRGSRAEEALLTVEEFLDKAMRDGLSSVRIVHGKGTGALRRAIRELLDQHPLVKSFAPEVPEKGGDGATIVDLT